MTSGVPEGNATGNLHMPAKRYSATYHEAAVVADIRMVTDMQLRVGTESGGKCNIDLAIDMHIVADNEFTASFDPGYVDVTRHTFSMPRAIGLEQRFGNEVLTNEKNDRTQGDENPQHRKHHNAWRGKREMLRRLSQLSQLGRNRVR